MDDLFWVQNACKVQPASNCDVVDIVDLRPIKYSIWLMAAKQGEAAAVGAEPPAESAADVALTPAPEAVPVVPPRVEFGQEPWCGNSPGNHHLFCRQDMWHQGELHWWLGNLDWWVMCVQLMCAMKHESGKIRFCDWNNVDLLISFGNLGWVFMIWQECGGIVKWRSE